MEICLVIIQYVLIRPKLIYTIFKNVNSIGRDNIDKLFPRGDYRLVKLVKLNFLAYPRDIVCTSVLVNVRFLTVVYTAYLITLELTWWPSFVLAPICFPLDTIRCWRILSEI